MPTQWPTRDRSSTHELLRDSQAGLWAVYHKSGGVWVAISAPLPRAAAEEHVSRLRAEAGASGWWTSEPHCVPL